LDWIVANGRRNFMLWMDQAGKVKMSRVLLLHT